MARADGVVSPLEREAFSKVFSFAPDEAANVERVFDLAKQDVAGYETYAGQIAALLKDERKLLQHVLEGLMYVAASDGALHPRGRRVPHVRRRPLRLFRQRVPLFPRTFRHGPRQSLRRAAA